ncbi:hypothetical protein Daus18300_012978 [Diaporthe australafricana]|uniref:Uncharacterized protein n=1 Tax=Diaporthe australafricana TaxID=127596 RepID=A0ABR3W0U4_9PEZI
MSSQPLNGLLASLNTLRGLSDVLEGDMENLLRVMSNPSPSSFAKFCDFFLLDPAQTEKFQHLDEELQIPFTKLRLPVYQVWDAYFMLTSKLRGLNGGILSYQYPSDSTYRTIYQKTPVSSENDVQVATTLGFALIFIRKGSVDEWLKLVERCSPNPLYYEALLIHHFYRENLRPGPNFKGKMEIRPVFRRITPRGEQSVFDAEWEVRPPANNNPQRQPERYIIFAGQESKYLARYRFFLSNQLSDFGYCGNELKGQVQIDPNGADRYSYGAHIGMHIIDEFDRLEDNSPVFKLIDEHRHITHNNVDTWAISAKPMSNGFSGLRSFLNCISKSKWLDPLHPNHFKHPSTLEASEMMYRKAIAPNMARLSQDLQIARDHFANQMFIYVCCRRTMTSRYFGQYISIYDKARADVRTASGGSFNTNQVVRCLKTFEQLIMCEIVSTFPGAASLLLENKVSVKPEDIGKIGSRRMSLAESPALLRNFDELTENSEKLKWIFKQIDLMLDVTDERQRMVITCTHLFEAALVLIAIQKEFDTAAVKAVYLPSRPTDFEKHIFSMNWSTNDRYSTRIVVVLADFEEESDLGLDRANWQVLTGPSRTKEQEAKIFSLTNTRQQRRKLHHFLLCTEDNPADRLILSRQADCNVISDPFDINSPLLLRELGPA